MKPIDLSDEQLAIVRAYVDSVHPRWRARHVAAIRAQLAAAPVISNKTVLEICANNAARAAMLGAGVAPELGDDD
jgi:hypothetical protein